MEQSEKKPGGSRTRRFVRGALYVVAFGLLGLSAVLFYRTYEPDIRFYFAQQELKNQLPSIAGLEPTSTSLPASPTLDFTAWETEDATFLKDLELGGAFGRIVAPVASIDARVLKGATQKNLALAPAWISTTDPPGETGNCAISGHRVTYGHPFRHLELLTVGETIYLYTPYRRYRYVVFDVLRVTPAHVEVLDHTDAPQLTLTTCDPPGSAVKRLVVKARLVEVLRIPRGQ